MRIERLFRGVAAAFLCLLAAASQIIISAAAAADVTLTDAGGRTVQISDASRILSVGGDITEIIYALGADARLVGVDSTSQFPAKALKDKANVGYMRALSIEGVISVGATLILASERAGPPEVVKTLKTTSVPYVEIPDQYSPQGIAAKVRLVARAIGAEAEGEQVVRQVEADFKALADGVKRIKQPAKVLFVLAAQNGRATVGGQGTSAHAILELAGATNTAAAVAGFKPLTDEAIIELAPEVIITMRRSSGNDGHDTNQLLTMKGVQSTPAGAANRLVVMDGLYLLSFGPRAPRAALDLMRQIYPELGGEPAGSHTGATK
ncbi:MAG TPA: ABC transporter substrate-binding protein [Hyphomicrobiaceae bacterium]|nr:ABC transporter substrate-binding protein [Hyphomicrobiaceae bacterium]